MLVVFVGSSLLKVPKGGNSSVSSDPLIHYFGSLLRERFGFGSAYLVFHNEDPIAAFKANTRNNKIELTDFVGDSELEKEAIRVMKELLKIGRAHV